MSFITAHSFIFNGLNSADFGVTIGWIDSQADVSANGLNRELKKTACTNKTKSNVYGNCGTNIIPFQHRKRGRQRTHKTGIHQNQPLAYVIRFSATAQIQRLRCLPAALLCGMHTNQRHYGRRKTCRQRTHIRNKLFFRILRSGKKDVCHNRNGQLFLSEQFRRHG